MKQSTKLLSLVLALLLAFSSLSVIGNAVLVRSEVSWDNIDDAALTAEQVADLALDLVDNDLLADMETIDLSIVGELRLNSVDNILTDIEDLTGGFIWTIGKGLLGDVGDMNFDALSGVRRSGGDLNVIYALLQFINDNADRISKIAYGIGTDNGISLGLIGSFLSLGKDVEEMLGNLPKYLTSMLFDMLVYGSYGYPNDTEALGGMSNLPAEADTIDEIAKVALLGLLQNPQDYEWEGEGEDAVKVWDENSYLSDTLHNMDSDTLWSNINPMAKSFFQILDYIAPIAIEEFGYNALNNNLKKALMEAVEIEFNEIDLAKLPAEVKTALETDKQEYEKSFVNYIAYDAIAKGKDGAWYYTTIETEVVVDATTGEPVLDKDGNEETERVRKYFKANMGAANEFGALINWDWKFGAGATTIDYAGLIKTNGSLVGSINELLGLVYDTALTAETKAAYKAMTGRDGWVKGANSNLMANLTNVTKYILVEFGDKVFGEGSAYASYTWDDVKNLSIIDLVAMIGPGFFEEAMPQIILPVNADGTYAFHDGVQLWEFGAVVLRELITGIAPEVNYDQFIFANGSVDANGAAGRQYASLSATEWFDLIVNMGIDVGYAYLNQITNLNTPVTAPATLEEATDGYRWRDMLTVVIEWALGYIGEGSASDGVLNGISTESVLAEGDPIDMLSFVLNKVLPLGFVGGAYTSDFYDLDLNLVVDAFQALLTDFDLTLVLDLLGRNTASTYNVLDDTNLANGVLTLVEEILELVFGTSNGTILQSIGGRNSTATQSLDAVLTQANLKTTVANLLKNLNARKVPIISNALPVVGKLMSGWGTEQEFKTPEIGISQYYDGTDGAISTAVTVNIRNASRGVWRHYVLANGTEGTDEQYKIQPTSVKAYNYDGSTSSYLTPAGLTTSVIDYGGSGSFTFTAAGIPTTGALARVDVKYKVYDENNQALVGGKEFTSTAYTYLNYNKTDERTYVENASTLLHAGLYTPFYVPLSGGVEAIRGAQVGNLRRNYKLFTSSQTGKLTNNTGTVDGLTPATVEITFSNPSRDQDYKKFDNLRLFDNYTAYADTKEGIHEASVAQISGQIDEAAWEAANKQSGSTSVWNYTLTDKDGSENRDLVLKYYDDVYKNKLVELVYRELAKNPLKEYYNTTGTSYAKEVLESEDTVDDKGETVLRQTNFATTGYNPKEFIPEGGKATEVTTIDNAAAWAEYYAALQYGAQVGLQAFNGNKTDWDFKSIYERLAVAANDAAYLRRNATELAAAGVEVDNVQADIEALETKLLAAEARTVELYDFTDYKMYRLNRFNEARDDAHYYVQLIDDAEPATVDEIDEYFDYSWMEENDYRALVNTVTDDTVERVSGTKTRAYLLALLEKFDAEEIAAKAEWLENKKTELAGQQAIDIAMTSNILTLTEERLLKRDCGVVTTQLEDEIASAENEILAASAYTADSYANYADALAGAKEALTSGSQAQTFDAKYNLLVMRKRLVKVGEEADYTELNALINFAKFALIHNSFYINGDKDFGMVLAELGMQTLTHEEGYEVQLFPGSALEVQARAYGMDDQNKVDRAADALKEALARLKFKGLKFTDANVADATIVEADENGEGEVIASVATIAANQSADAVKAFFADKISADSASIDADDITVSNDTYYTVDTDLTGFTGTNATITFYDVIDNVKIPVSTVKVVVEGDVNGDGTVDVLDASYAALVAAQKGELDGCYLLAGDLVADDRTVADADFQQIANMSAE